MQQTPRNEQSTDAARRRTGRSVLLAALLILLLWAGAEVFRSIPGGPAMPAVAPVVAPATQVPPVAVRATPSTSSMPPQPATKEARPAIAGAKKNPAAVSANETPGQPVPPGLAANGKPVQPIAPADTGAPQDAGAQQQTVPPPAEPAIAQHVEPAAMPQTPAGPASTRSTPWPFGLVPGITPAVACARLVQESGGTCSARLDSGGALEVRVRPGDPDWPARLRESLDSLGWQEEQPPAEDGAHYSRGTPRGNERFEWTIAGRDWTLRLIAAPGR